MLCIWKFLENLRMEDIASLTGVNEISYIYATTVTPYHILKGYNSLVNSVCYVTNTLEFSIGIILTAALLNWD